MCLPHVFDAVRDDPSVVGGADACEEALLEVCQKSALKMGEVSPRFHYAEVYSPQ